MTIERDTNKVYTINDLRSWETRGEQHLDFAVIGHPIDHSQSPKIFNTAFEKIGQKIPYFKNYRYYKFDIKPEELEEALKLFHEKKFGGLNVTAPLKELVGDYLSPCNTLTANPTSDAYVKTNTDLDGFSYSTKLLDDATDLHALILGAGGVAITVARAILTYTGCQKITIHNRSKHKADLLATFLRQEFPNADIYTTDFDERFLRGSPCNFIINATPLGVNPDDPSPLPIEFLDRRETKGVIDLTYGEHESTLIKEARKRNIPCQNGRAMLATQGALSFQMWTGIPAKDAQEIMLEAIKTKPTEDRYVEINKSISKAFRKFAEHVGFTSKAINYCLPSDDELTSFPHDYLTSIIDELRKIAEKSVELIAIPALVNKHIEESCWGKFTINEEVFREWINTMMFNPEVDIKHNEDNQDMEASLEDMLTSVRSIINYACDDGFINLRWNVRIKMFTKYLSFRKLFKITHFDYETMSRRAVGVFDVLLP